VAEIPTFSVTAMLVGAFAWAFAAKAGGCPRGATTCLVILFLSVLLGVDRSHAEGVSETHNPLSGVTRR
jgi:hypothetical protein